MLWYFFGVSLRNKEKKEENVFVLLLDVSR